MKAETCMLAIAQALLLWTSCPRDSTPRHESPGQRTSGWVKQAAGTELWLRMYGRSQMFSTALMPCALAACASMYLPAQHTTSQTVMHSNMLLL